MLGGICCCGGEREGTVVDELGWVVVFGVVAFALILVCHSGAPIWTHCAYRPERVAEVTRKKDAPSEVLGGGKGSR